MSTNLRKSLLLRYTGLLLATAFAGFITGILEPLGAGVRGALLGASLGAGLILINSLSRRRLDAGLAPEWSVVLLSAVASGLLAAVLVSLYGGGPPAGGADFLHGVGPFIREHGVGGPPVQPSLSQRLRSAMEKEAGNIRLAVPCRQHPAYLGAHAVQRLPA
jgi:hypothetical protein